MRRRRPTPSKADERAVITQLAVGLDERRIAEATGWSLREVQRLRQSRQPEIMLAQAHLGSDIRWAEVLGYRDALDLMRRTVEGSVQPSTAQMVAARILLGVKPALLERLDALWGLTEPEAREDDLRDKSLEELRAIAQREDP